MKVFLMGSSPISTTSSVHGIGQVDLTQYRVPNGLELDDLPLIKALCEHHNWVPNKAVEGGDGNLLFEVVNLPLLVNDGRIRQAFADVDGFHFLTSKAHKAVFWLDTTE